jgi:hypothetical protein
MFFSEKFKDRFLTLFCAIKKVYNAFSRLAYLYKYKKSPTKITTDMYLTPIEETQKNVICIYDDRNSCKYLFTISDLMQIMKKSLIHSPNFFSDPVECKNPYTNIPFNKSTLYNIYFFIKTTNYIMPDVIHNFFMDNFDIEQFVENNQFMLREYSIKDHVNNLQPDSCYSHVQAMFQSYKKNCHIHPEFPRKKLLEIMRPYLYYYFVSNYSLCYEKKQEYSYQLRKKLTLFFNHNPNFGKKFLKLQIYAVDGSGTNPFTSKKSLHRIPFFDDRHISFYESDSKSFMKSHLRNDDVVEESNNSDLFENEENQHPEVQDDLDDGDDDDNPPDLIDESSDEENDDVIRQHHQMQQNEELMLFLEIEQENAAMEND